LITIEGNCHANKNIDKYIGNTIKENLSLEMYTSQLNRRKTHDRKIGILNIGSNVFHHFLFFSISSSCMSKTNRCGWLYYLIKIRKIKTESPHCYWQKLVAISGHFISKRGEDDCRNEAFFLQKECNEVGSTIKYITETHTHANSIGICSN
jgi:hypothetical protein